VLLDGYIIQNVTGIRMRIVRRLDGTGYEVRKRKMQCTNASLAARTELIVLTVGHYNVRPGHLVYINDSSLFLPDGNRDAPSSRDSDIPLRFFMEEVDPMFEIQTGMQGVLDSSNEFNALITGHQGHFGGDLSAKAFPQRTPPRFARKEGSAVHRDFDNTQGCHGYAHSYPDAVLLLHRGGCTFLEKLLHARAASAAGVLVISDVDSVFNPTANLAELETAGDLSDAAIVVLSRKAGQVIMEMMDRAEQWEAKQVMVALDHKSRPPVPDTGHIPEQRTKDPNRILYINGHPLLNTRLLI
jgi:mannosidase alpha-like ER degradation enhancer 1